MTCAGKTVTQHMAQDGQNGPVHWVHDEDRRLV